MQLLKHLKSVRTKVYTSISKVVLSLDGIKVDSGVSFDGFPNVMIDKNAKIYIGENCIIGRGVEIRAHGNATVTLGKNVKIDRGVRLLAANDAKLHIGDGTRVGLYSVFNGGDDIKIGSNCLISGFVYLQTSMHRYGHGSSIQAQGYDHEPVMLGSDVWLGTHVVILPGCMLGNGSVIGSNAVVTKSVNDNSIMAGVPAKLIGNREKKV